MKPGMDTFFSCYTDPVLATFFFQTENELGYTEKNTPNFSRACHLFEFLRKENPLVLFCTMHFTGGFKYLTTSGCTHRRTLLRFSASSGVSIACDRCGLFIHHDARVRSLTDATAALRVILRQHRLQVLNVFYT